MDVEEARKRNRVLRAYFKGRDWDGQGEFQLKCALANEGHTVLAAYPYLVDDEWEVSPGQTNKGRGDLVFTDGHGHWATVETKWIDGGTDGGSGKTRRTSKRTKRRKVEKQAIEYASLLKYFRDDVDHVEAFLHTNETPMVRIERPLLDDLALRERFPQLFLEQERAEFVERLGLTDLLGPDL